MLLTSTDLPPLQVQLRLTAPCKAAQRAKSSHISPSPQPCDPAAGHTPHTHAVRRAQVNCEWLDLQALSSMNVADYLARVASNAPSTLQVGRLVVCVCVCR